MSIQSMKVLALAQACVGVSGARFYKSKLPNVPSFTGKGENKVNVWKWADGILKEKVVSNIEWIDECGVVSTTNCFIKRTEGIFNISDQLKLYDCYTYKGERSNYLFGFKKHKRTVCQPKPGKGQEIEEEIKGSQKPTREERERAAEKRRLAEYARQGGIDESQVGLENQGLGEKPESRPDSDTESSPMSGSDGDSGGDGYYDAKADANRIRSAEIRQQLEDDKNKITGGDGYHDAKAAAKSKRNAEIGQQVEDDERHW